MAYALAYAPLTLGDVLGTEITMGVGFVALSLLVLLLAIAIIHKAE